MQNAGGTSLELLQAISVLYDVLSKVKPRLYTVPLLPWAGWSLGRSMSH